MLESDVGLGQQSTSLCFLNFTRVFRVFLAGLESGSDLE